MYSTTQWSNGASLYTGIHRRPSTASDGKVRSAEFTQHRETCVATHIPMYMHSKSSVVSIANHLLSMSVMISVYQTLVLLWLVDML